MFVEIVLSLSGEGESETWDIFADVTVGGEAVVSGLLFAVVLPLFSDPSVSSRTLGRGGGLDISKVVCIPVLYCSRVAKLSIVEKKLDIFARRSN